MIALFLLVILNSCIVSVGEVQQEKTVIWFQKLFVMEITNSSRSTAINVSAIGNPPEIIQGHTKIIKFTPKLFTQLLKMAENTVESCIVLFDKNRKEFISAAKTFSTIKGNLKVIGSYFIFHSFHISCI